MKLLLLKILLQRRARDDGYVLPMVMAIGLVMLLLGAVNLTSAKEESFNAITKNSRSDALGIAEVGVAQYREMLNRNRILTIYNRDQWTSNNVNGVDVAAQTCDVITNTLNGWANHDHDLPGSAIVTPFNPDPPTAIGTQGKDYWRAVTLDETVVGIDLNDDGDATDNTVDIGWYKIVDYEYDIDGNIGDANNDDVIDDIDDNGVFSVVSDANTADDDPADVANFGTLTVLNRDENDNNDDGTSDARGILTVKSRTPDGSEAQIEVEIPLRINPEDMNNLAPALWIGDGNTGSLGGLVVGDADGDNLTDDVIDNLTGVAGADGIPDANIVASRPNDAVNAGCAPAASDSTTTNTIVSDPRGLPAIDLINQNSITQNINNANAAALAAVPSRTIDFNTGAAFLGAVGDFEYNPDVAPDAFDPTTDCVVAENCRYYYDNVNSIVGRDYLVDGVSPVTLYDDAALLIDATGVTGTTMTLGSSISSKFLEIYNTQGITINTGGKDVTINALIHTPGTLTISGGGTLTINGSVWVGTFDNQIGTVGAVTINPDTTASSSSASDRSYEFYTTTNNRTPRPLTGSPTNWKTEEVN